MALLNGAWWYEEAADKLFDELEYHEFGELKYVQENDPRFHSNGGMWVRNQLRDFGFTDDKYGNLDDHYQSILNLLFKKVGFE